MHANTIVTAYYPVASKFPHDTYLEWMRAMLAVPCPMVVFTTAEFSPIITSMRKAQDKPTHIVVQSLDDLEWTKRYSPEFWKRQEHIDPERQSVHKTCCYDLYRIWNSKLAWVEQAIGINPFGSKRFWWMDIGSIRDGKRWKVWPESVKADRIPDNKVAIIHIPSTHQIAGGMFAGTPEAIRAYSSAFYETLHHWAQQGRFIGKDQMMMQDVVKRHLHRFHIMSGTPGPREWWHMWDVMGVEDAPRSAEGDSC